MESIERIHSQSMEAEPISAGGTKILLQRHQEFIRDKEDEKAGHLTANGKETGEIEAEQRIQNLIEQVPETERDNLFFLILASDTTYENGGARSMETADIIAKKIRELLIQNCISEENLLNISREYRGAENGGPKPVANLREPLMFEESPAFVQFLKEKYPEFKDFWIAFETEVEKETREKMGAEGPEEMADRIEKYLKVLKRYSTLFHKEKPDSRLIIWCVSHYDTISPWTKKYVLDQSITENHLPVDYGAGLAVDLDEEGNASIDTEGKKFKLEL